MQLEARVYGQGAELKTPSKERTLHVPVLGAPCVRRAPLYGNHSVSDEAIFEGYRG